MNELLTNLKEIKVDVSSSSAYKEVDFLRAYDSNIYCNMKGDSFLERRKHTHFIFLYLFKQVTTHITFMTQQEREKL